MQKCVILLLSVIILCAVFVGVKKHKTDEKYLVGTIIEKSDRTFTISNASGEIVCTFPKNYDLSKIKEGDDVKIFYEGEVTETSPMRIREVTKVELE